MNTFEEYRYDALGRRIAKRAQRRACENYCVSTIERFIWDGDDLLQEIRYPGRWDSPSDSLEVDTGYVMQKIWSPCPPATPCWDTTYVPKQFGSVVYEYDGQIDHPVTMRRLYFAKDTATLQDWANLYPHYDAKGNAAGDTKNTSPITDVGFQVSWPAADTRSYGLYASGTVQQSWFGSVVYGGQDATGLQYKRNRYYNAEGGRFTQEDPIGLAGGLNLYGFATGDPVNFSDPFGLCTLGKDCWAAFVRLAKEVHAIFTGSESPARFVNPAMLETFGALGGLAREAAISELSAAGRAMDRGGLTRAGRQLDKHGGREGGAFPRATGSVSSKNAQGQEVLDNILNNPASSMITRNTGRFGTVLEVYAPDGRGARFSARGDFIGFLEPRQR